MALYIDSAFIDDIMVVTQIVPVSGITTNPSILLTAHERGACNNSYADMANKELLRPGDRALMRGTLQH
jgi:transaldolase